MGLPFLSRYAVIRKQTVAIVLGAHTTKAVLIQSNGNKFRLLNYTLCPTPALAKEASLELLSEHLKNVFKTLEARTKEVILVIGMGEVLLRSAELPFYDPARTRQMVKLNAQNYVRQELADFEVDCCMAEKAAAEITATRPSADFGEGEVPASTVPAGKAGLKYRVLVGAAPKSLVSQLQAAAAAAGLDLRQLTFSQTSLANAVGLARPEAIENEVVALVDLGFRTSTVSILCHGQLYVTRVVEMGAEHITKSLAETLGVNYAAAEVVELLMPEKVEPKLRKLISTLSQELRAVIDFFEAQEGKTVTQIFVAGGAARSRLVIETLQHELGHPCERLDPAAFLDLALPPLKIGGLDKDAPQLAAAIGAAVTWSVPQSIRINLLAEAQEAAERRRQDPVRRGVWVAGLMALLFLAWAGLLRLEVYVKDLELQGTLSQLQWSEKSATLVSKYRQQASLTEGTAQALDQQAAERSLWTLPLNALQEVAVDGVQLTRLSMSQNIIRPAAPLPKTKGGKKILAKPDPTLERLTLTLDAKNQAEPAAVDQFIEAIGKQSYFRDNLRAVNPVVLVQRLPPQVDPLDPAKTFTRFTVECYFRDRVLGYE